jgi:acetate---CoA ligase (ADP-forming)
MVSPMAGAPSSPVTVLASEADVEFVRLRDGSKVTVREACPRDGAALTSFLEGLSPEARRMRCLRGAVDVASAVRLASGPGEGQYGLIAHDETGALAAHAIFIRIGARAEVAIEVADRLCGRGLGTFLIERLAAVAEERGITHFVAEVLPDNHAMLDVFRDGFNARVAFRYGVESVEFPTSSWRVASRRFHPPAAGSEPL